MNMPGSNPFMSNYSVNGPTSGGFPGSTGFTRQGFGAFQAGSGLSGSGFGTSQQPSWMSRVGGFMGSEGFQNGVSAFSTLANMYTGFKSLGLAKDQLNFQKKAWNKNYEAQLKDYENNLRDRWISRNTAAGHRGQSFMGMNEWVSGRTPGGSANNEAGGYRAQSAQDFYAGAPQQANTPIDPQRRKAAPGVRG